MNKHPRKSGHNVVRLPTKPAGDPAADFAAGAPAVAGDHDDPRAKEAMPLIKLLLAIEDASARAALIALAESLVTHDWLRRSQQRRARRSTLIARSL